MSNYLNKQHKTLIVYNQIMVRKLVDQAIRDQDPAKYPPARPTDHPIPSLIWEPLIKKSFFRNRITTIVNLNNHPKQKPCLVSYKLNKQGFIIFFTILPKYLSLSLFTNASMNLVSGDSVSAPMRSPRGKMRTRLPTGIRWAQAQGNIYPLVK